MRRLTHAVERGANAWLAPARRRSRRGARRRDIGALARPEDDAYTGRGNRRATLQRDWHAAAAPTGPSAPSLAAPWPPCPIP